MAYKVIILYQLYMPSYFLGTFTEYPYVGLGRSQLNGTVYLCFGHNAHEYSRDVYKFNPEEFRFIPLNTLLPDRYPGITRSYASF